MHDGAKGLGLVEHLAGGLGAEVEEGVGLGRAMRRQELGGVFQLCGLGP